MDEQETKQYELCFWLKDDNSSAAPLSLFESVKNLVQKSGGVITSEHQPEKRNLAYPIQKQRAGFWCEIVFSGVPEVLRQIESGLKYETAILRKTMVVCPVLKKMKPRREHLAKSAEISAATLPDLRSPQEIQEQLDTKLKEILET
jgi:ribosomal protein S6